MNASIYNIRTLVKATAFMLLFLLLAGPVAAQDPPAEKPKEAVSKKYVKNTFESIWLLDNQTVMVPIKGTFEMDILHRFGTMDKGYKDFFGFFAPSNIRLGFSYSPINNLMAGISITKSNMTWEGYAKYAIIKQTKGKGYPVSVTYYANLGIETRTKDNYVHFTDRLSYFHQLLIARKINDWLSLQVAPSISHMNFVNGQFVDTSIVKSGRVQDRKHDHFAIALSGKFKIREGMGILFNYDQPVTKHRTANPRPNLSLGLEVTTSSHAFQIFVGNYYFITPQRNNYFNQNKGLEFNDGKLEHGKQFLIGFNITRLWNW
ncbi:MAG: DUF5777 family beta-barrel protein [Chitinophagaceae bacterium]|nr:DUF5777 family beta-barrel protein [Chitinophagaceae bacterium]